jgi:hypothetical protein
MNQHHWLYKIFNMVINMNRKIKLITVCILSTPLIASGVVVKPGYISIPLDFKNLDKSVNWLGGLVKRPLARQGTISFPYISNFKYCAYKELRSSGSEGAGVTDAYIANDGTLKIDFDIPCAGQGGTASDNSIVAAAVTAIIVYFTAGAGATEASTLGTILGDSAWYDFLTVSSWDSFTGIANSLLNQALLTNAFNQALDANFKTKECNIGSAGSNLTSNVEVIYTTFDDICYIPYNVGWTYLTPPENLYPDVEIYKNQFCPPHLQCKPAPTPPQPVQLPLQTALFDSDGDGILDATDNCLTKPNPNQQDSDSDGYGNACDLDLNNDCAVNSLDLGIFKKLYTKYSSAIPDALMPIADYNTDASVNTQDLTLMQAGYHNPPGPSGVAQCPN